MHELEPDRSIRADIFLTASLLTNASPARDALTRVFQGMPVCQVMPALRILQFSVPLVKLMALQFSSLPSWAAPAFLLVVSRLVLPLALTPARWLYYVKEKDLSVITSKLTRTFRRGTSNSIVIAIVIDIVIVIIVLILIVIRIVIVIVIVIINIIIVVVVIIVIIIVMLVLVLVLVRVFVLG